MLLNEHNWDYLKGNLQEGGISQKNINYIVGAPTLEMMVDSYNTRYASEIEDTDTPDNSNRLPEERRKIFCRYIEEETGYQVGPCAEEENVNGYGKVTEHLSLVEDIQKEDVTYDPKDHCHYFLATPAIDTEYCVYIVLAYNQGEILSSAYNYHGAICPLVSLKPDTIVKLKN